MKRHLSIQWRLALQFSLTVLLILSISGGLVFFLFVEKAQGNIDNLLFVQYKNIQDSLHQRFLIFHDTELRDETFQEINDQKQIDLFSVVINQQGRVIEKTSKGKLVLEWKPGYSNGIVDGHPHRFYMNEEDGMKVVVGENLETYNKNVRSLAVLFFAVFGLMLLISFSLSALFAKRALAPLRLLHEKVRDLGPHNLPEASLASAYKSGDEIGKLATTFDAFLVKLSQAFQRERQFTQDASHELRTPLTVMKSSLELINLKSHTLDRAQREKLLDMERSVLQMETLVNDLLFLSRGMRRQQEREAISVGAFLKKFAGSYHLLAKEKGLKFKMEIVHDFQLKTSVAALEKTVGNLLKNAIQYTEKGGVTLTVDAPEIQVADTGIGIAEKDQKHIFERFFQTDSARATGVHGFGLGLAIAREICQQEGWNLSVHSESGKGSVFKVNTHP